MSTTPLSNKIRHLPSGGISSTSVQGAIQELDSEKVALSALAASNGSELVGYQATGGVPRRLKDKLGEFVSVKDFGAVGDGVTDDRAAIQTAVNAALVAGKTLYFPCGQYFIASSIVVNNSISSQWSTLSWEGEQFITGNSLFQNSVSGVKDGTVIITDSTTAVSIMMDNFFNESVHINNMSFWNKGARGLTAAIIFEKDSASYVRGHEFNRLGFYNFDTCLVFRGLDADINNNFFGPTTVKENFVYDCGVGLYFENTYVNLFEVSNSLYHGCDKYGVQLVPGSGANMTLKATHFEACEPAGILCGTLNTALNFDCVSAESTGVVSGNGLLKTSESVNALVVNVTNNVYNGIGFALMPDEYRLNRGAVINAACPVKVSGYGWITNTPETVTPVVSNNAAYNQADLSTFGMTPVHSNVSRLGVRVFDKFTGWNSAAGLGYTPPNSFALPDAIRSNFVGVAPGTATIANTTDTYTAPSNGYIYASWIAKYAAVDNGFWLGNSQMNIGGTDVLVKGYNFGPGTYNFVVVAPINTGQLLGRTELRTTGASTWATGAYVTFETSYLNMIDAACGYPKSITTEYSLLTANNLNVDDYGDGATPFSIRVQLFFNGGAYGYKEYVISGDGGVAANRVYITVASSVVAGIAVTTNTGANTALYDITVANTSGVTVSVTKIVTYIS